MCTNNENSRIIIYAESHSKNDIMKFEREEWNRFYHENGFRHFFVEYPHYTAQMLNIWMHSDNDDMLMRIYDAWEGSLAHDPVTLEYYRYIKENCPETVFHGTDIGHQYNTLGAWYLEFLENNGMKDTEDYRLSKEAYDQGAYYRSGEKRDRKYREMKMGDNFIAAYERLGRPDIMAVYGSAHMNMDGIIEGEPRFIVKIHAKYGDKITLHNLTEKFGYK